MVDDASYKNAYFQLKDNLQSDFPLTKIQSFFDYPDESGGMVSVGRHKAIMTAGLPDSVIDYTGAPPFTLDDFESAVGDNPLTVTFGGNYLSNIEVKLIAFLYKEQTVFTMHPFSCDHRLTTRSPRTSKSLNSVPSQCCWVSW